jgi:UDP-galactopyranose mutase
LEEYRGEARNFKNFTFGGRLGRYQYLDMHMAIGAAFSDFETLMREF